MESRHKNRFRNSKNAVIGYLGHNVRAHWIYEKPERNLICYTGDEDLRSNGDIADKNNPIL